MSVFQQKITKQGKTQPEETKQARKKANIRLRYDIDTVIIGQGIQNNYF